MVDIDAGLICRVHDMWIDNRLPDAGFSRGATDVIGVGVICLCYAVLRNGISDISGAGLI